MAPSSWIRLTLPDVQTAQDIDRASRPASPAVAWPRGGVPRRIGRDGRAWGVLGVRVRPQPRRRSRSFVPGSRVANPRGVAVALCSWSRYGADRGTPCPEPDPFRRTCSSTWRSPCDAVHLVSPSSWWHGLVIASYVVPPRYNPRPRSWSTTTRCPNDRAKVVPGAPGHRLQTLNSSPEP